MRDLVDVDHPITLSRQCALLGLARSSYYYEPVPRRHDLPLCREIDAVYTDHPYYGVVRMTLELQARGLAVGPKRVRRLMRAMGIEAIYPKPRTSVPAPGHRIWPYLLGDLAVTHPNQVWAVDMTYLPLSTRGFGYLTAVMDWYSRYVLAWGLSNTMDAEFCAGVLQRALRAGRPMIHNSDQGSQFTSDVYTSLLTDAGVRISMDGRGRWLDNVFIERLWRTVKYEDVYLRGYTGLHEADRGLGAYFNFYNEGRRHQALQWKTPVQVWSGEAQGPPVDTGARKEEHGIAQ